MEERIEKTTKKHFLIFVKACKEWQIKLGMMGWQLYFEHKTINNGAYAEFSCNQVGRVATITLNKEWHETTIRDLTENEIKKTAFHEMFEILLHRLAWIVSNELGSKFEDEETHNVVRVFENIFFGEKEK